MIQINMIQINYWIQIPSKLSNQQKFSFYFSLFSFSILLYPLFQYCLKIHRKKQINKSIDDTKRTSSNHVLIFGDSLYLFCVFFLSVKMHFCFLMTHFFHSFVGQHCLFLLNDNQSKWTFKHNAKKRKYFE